MPIAKNALRAVSMGAYDFFNKPINAELLSFLVNRAYRMHELESENRQLQQSRQHSRLKVLSPAARPCWKSARPLKK